MFFLVLSAVLAQVFNVSRFLIKLDTNFSNFELFHVVTYTS